MSFSPEVEKPLVVRAVETARDLLFEGTSIICAVAWARLADKRNKELADRQGWNELDPMDIPKI